MAYKTWPASINNGQRACHKPLNWVFVLTIYGVAPHAALTLYATPFYGGGTSCHKTLNWVPSVPPHAFTPRGDFFSGSPFSTATSHYHTGSCHKTLNWAACSVAGIKAMEARKREPGQHKLSY